MDCKVEDDDSGGHTHGDMSVLEHVPPNSSLPELLHGGQDVAVGGLVAPVHGLAVGIGWELVTVVSSLLPCDELPPPEDCDRGGQVPGLIDFCVCPVIAHFIAVFNRLLCDGPLLAEDIDTGGLGGELLPLPKLGLPLLLPVYSAWEKTRLNYIQMN